MREQRSQCLPLRELSGEELGKEELSKDTLQISGRRGGDRGGDQALQKCERRLWRIVRQRL